ncbi:MAG: TorF family putative porin [Acinetobacter faecalis]|uniref:Uncharacterized protein n=1 Tax=Acinetobacter faecalis TaxID=2665161 RepID=A0A6L6GCG0_9GAMM|nr:TorF family putative porin [Acinetobacter faecalis]MDY6461081.1 TorF family putative porin [Acinetobacter faecalis]MTD10271.1 hypothetical protein [Acinetobacter faecalis]
MKFTLKALSLALVASASTVTFADEAPSLPLGLEFSGSTAMTTDYRFRGLTQTLSDPAVQVGFQLDHSTGLYAGVWGSNVDFGGDSAHLEVDPYIGYAKTFENLPGAPTLDVGVWYYGYPGYSETNFIEYYAGLGFEGLVAEGDSLSTSVAYSSDWLGAGYNSWYYGLGYTMPFGSSGFGGVVSVGYSDFEKNYSENYWDWKAGVSYEFKSIEGFGAELAAVGSDVDTSGWSHRAKRGVETGAVFTLTKSF